ncbi:hypothetical protein [Ascidiimonas sp. W6]|uniref:hypothetical protein n=1 Tax=Ascidiimonas meishanensis TaxID=3128903 RepID=UPI0030EE5D65
MRTINSNEIIDVSNSGDHWVCICGNNTMSDGFDTCDVNGAYIEPLDGIWTGLYTCLKCGRVIDQDTYEVISRTNDLSSFGTTITK